MTPASGYYLCTGGKTVGPYSRLQLESVIESGSVDLDTLAWHDGLSGWVPLRDIVTEWSLAPYAASGTAGLSGGAAPRPCWITRVSVGTGLLSVGIWLALMLYFTSLGSPADSPPHGLAPWIGLLGIVSLVLVGCIGVIFSLIGLFAARASRWWSLAGLILNTLPTLVLIGRIVTVLLSFLHAVRSS